MAADGSTPEDAMPLGVVSAHIGGWIRKLGQVWVRGQVVEVNRRQHVCWLRLRDEHAKQSMSVSIGRHTLDSAGPIPEGSVVVVHAQPRWWDQQGSLTLQATEIRPSGQGMLLAQLEALKTRLQAEGLFDQARKRRLPVVPRHIALVTAPGSDAERDVTRHVLRRWPAATLSTQPVRVQGQHAAAEVIEAVAALDARSDVDVIVIARGGGAMEDLLAFSDEGVVRAVAACRTPVVSAIGHDKDVPILDLVADVRASTPTDAGRHLVPDAEEERRGLHLMRQRLHATVEARVARERDWLSEVRRRPVMADPVGGLLPHRERLAELRRRHLAATTASVGQHATGLEHTLRQLRALSPQATLERGYAIARTPDHRTITSIDDAEAGQSVAIMLRDGTLAATVTDTTRKEQP